VTGVTVTDQTVTVNYTATPAAATGAHSSIAYTTTVFIAIPADKLPATPFTIEDFGGPVTVNTVAR
jgi:hypothetical protein